MRDRKSSAQSPRLVTVETRTLTKIFIFFAPDGRTENVGLERSGKPEEDFNR